VSEKTVSRLGAFFLLRGGGLKRRLFISMILIITMLMVGVFIIVENNSKKMILSQGKKRAISSALYLAALSKAPFLMYDYTKLEQNVGEIAKEPEIVYAIILDREGRVVAHSARDDLIGRRLLDPISKRAMVANSTFVQEYLYRESEDKIWDVSYPIFIQNTKWGVVRIGFSKDYLIKQITQNRKDLLIIGLVAIIFAGLIANLLSDRITVPLQKLSHIAVLISKGDLKQKIDIKTGDEIEDLSKAFNHMVYELNKQREKQKKLIEELKQRNQQLKDEIAARKQLEEEIIKMERLRALGQMSGGVAHDFNNILGAILGRAQLILEKSKNPDINRDIKIIEKAAFDGAETVRRIQEFSRIRVDDTQFVPMNIDEIIEDSIEFTRTKWKNEAIMNGANISVNHKSKGNFQVLGEPTGLREVFTNLIINAVDAMPHGGSINILTKRVGSRVIISVKDTGIGMSKEVMKRTFDPFFTTKGSKGNGLGLSICYGIVNRHNGTIEVESEEGVGTTFTISLPLIEPEEKKMENVKYSVDISHTTVLIIDDDDTIRSLISDVLKQSGCKVITADTGKKGIDTFDPGCCDIVLTDLGLDDISGWEVVKEIKAVSPDTPVIIITGWGGQLSKDELNEYGVDFVIPKPFRINELKNYINKAINLKMGFK